MNVELERSQLQQHLHSNGIRDSRVLTAIGRTPRERFVSQDLQLEAYCDTALPIDCEQTISQPYIVARMTEALALTGHETVLEIGTGSGYQSAILAQLCAKMVTIERFPELSRTARSVLNDLGLHNIEYHVGDGSLGYPERAPYDGIIVTAASPDVPAPLYDQLRMGGRLVIPVGDQFTQVLQVIVKETDGPVSESLGGCRFVKLIGEAGWPDN